MEDERAFCLGDVYEAIEKGDLFKLKNIGGKLGKIDCNSVYTDETPLTRAVRLKSFDIISYLLEQTSVDVDAPNRFGRTPILLAARDGDLPLVKRLVSRGADVNQSDREGDTCLHLAAFYDHAEVINVLLDAGGDIDHRNNKGQTPLYTALDHSALSSAQVLMQRGCNVNMASNNNKSPLMSLVDLRLGSEIYNDKKLSDFINSIEMLIERGADIHYVDSNGNNALHYAVKSKNMYAVVYLLCYGCRADMRNSSNRNAFELAIESGQFETSRYMTLYTSMWSLLGIDKELEVTLFRDIFSGDNYSEEKCALRSKLLETVSEKHAKALKALISSRKNPQNSNDSNSALIDGVVKVKSLQILSRCKILLNLRGNPIKAVKWLPIASRLQRFLLHYDPCFDVDLHSLARLNVAAIEGDLEYVAHLTQTEEKFDYMCNILFDQSTAVEKAVKFENNEVLQFLLSNVSFTTDSISKLLHIVVQNEGTSTLEFLLSKGADMNVTNSENEMPIHLAARAGNFRAVELLILETTDGLKHDKTGKHTIHYAAASGNHKVVAMLLLQHPELVSARDDFDFSPLHLATSRGNVYLERNIDLPALFTSKMFLNSAIMKLMYSPFARNISLPKYREEVSHRDVVNILMQHGADLHLASVNGTPQALAVKYGYEDSFSDERH